MRGLAKYANWPGNVDVRDVDRLLVALTLIDIFPTSSPRLPEYLFGGK